LLRDALHPIVARIGRPLSFAFLPLLRISSRRVGIALMYHSVAEVQGDLDREIVPPHGANLFAAQMRHLTRHYRVVGAQELLGSARARRRGGRFPIAITFDDDLRCHKEIVLPILARARTTATFFLTGSSLNAPFALWWERLQRASEAGMDVARVTGISALGGSIHDIGRAIEKMAPSERERVSTAIAAELGPDPPTSGLRADDVRALVRGGMKIGFHTLRHDSLPSLDDEQLPQAMTDGRADLEAVAGERLTTIAYPHGHSDDRVAAAARAAGFEFGFTTRVEPVGQASDPLLLGRMGPSYRSTGHFAVQLLRLLLARTHQ
jgi:peptidoglycan/xylan/chitin deacetylase (PgdA/CDA1 family)